MPPRKAQAISLTSINRAVDAAVKIAAARHDLAVDKDTLLHRWEIVGRRLRDVKDLNVAYRFAEDVAQRVKIGGLKVDPVLTRIDKDILVGFIERGMLPRIISR